METEFKKGDVVSHGSDKRIKMVVAYSDSDGVIYCRYYNSVTGLFTVTGLFPYEINKG